MEDVPVPVPDGEMSLWHRPSTGDTATVALVHGLSGNSRWWGPVIDHLPGDLGILALDIRGRGESVGSPPPYDLTTVADDVARSLDHFDVNRAIVAGYSMGGWIAALFGVNHAERVERLLLVDGGLPIPRDPNVDAEDLIDSLVGPSLRRLEMTFETEAAFFKHWRGHPAFERHWDDAMRPALGHELVPEGDHLRVRANPEAIEVGARDLAVSTEANEAVSNLEVRTHVVVVERGTLDQPGGMIPLEAAERMAATNSRFTMEYLADLNHYTLILGAGAGSIAAAITAG